MEERAGQLSNGNISDHSAALAEKLLQGWALLQEHCPQCLTPLVRNRQRKMYCVACAQWVVSQSEAAEQLVRERVAKDGSESSGNPSLSSLPFPEPVSSSHNVREMEQQGLVRDPPEPSRPSSSAPEGLNCVHDPQQSPKRENSTSTLVIPKLAYQAKTLEQVLPGISCIVIHKLEEIGNAIKATQDVEEIRLLMKALSESLQTMDAVLNTADFNKRVLRM